MSKQYFAGEKLNCWFSHFFRPNVSHAFLCSAWICVTFFVSRSWNGAKHKLWLPKAKLEHDKIIENIASKTRHFHFVYCMFFQNELRWKSTITEFMHKFTCPIHVFVCSILLLSLTFFFSLFFCWLHKSNHSIFIACKHIHVHSVYS